MVERLKLISRRTPWSLLLKAALLAAVWELFPFWIFAASAIILYSWPVFRIREFFPEFAVLLFLAWRFEGRDWTAFLLFGLFVLLFGMKDLLIIDRSKGYEALFLMAALMGAVAFYSSPWGSSSRGIAPFLAAGFLGITIGLFLLRIPYEGEGLKSAGLPAALSGFLIWQMGFILLFLPFNFFEASAILFSFIAGFGTTIAAWRKGEADEALILISFALFAVITVAVLFLAPWRV